MEKKSQADDILSLVTESKNKIYTQNWLLNDITLNENEQNYNYISSKYIFSNYFH